jgi:hypothetical protein
VRRLGGVSRNGLSRSKRVRGDTFCAGFEEGFGLCEAETARCARDEDDFVEQGEFGEAGCCWHLVFHTMCKLTKRGVELRV